MAEINRHKNNHGDGGFVFRGDVEYYRFSYKDALTGKSKIKEMKVDYSVKKPKDIIKRAARQWLDDYERSAGAFNGKVTVKEWCEQYIETYCADNRSKTVSTYKETAKRIGEYIGDVPMAKLTPAIVQNVFNGMLKTLSPVTVNKHRTAFKTFCKHAEINHIIKENPVAKTKRPKMDKIKQIKAMTEEQAQAVLIAANEQSTRDYVAVMLALKCGMRSGEVWGLRWQDVDFDGLYINIRQAAVENEGKIIIELPKDGEYRSIKIDATTAKILKLWKKQQEWNEKERGDLYVDNGLVCPNAFGGYMHGSNFTSRAYRRILVKAGLVGKDWIFHDLQHTFATLLLLRGVAVTIVSKMLGHAKISTTLDHYAHLLPHSQDDAVKEITDIFRAIEA